MKKLFILLALIVFSSIVIAGQGPEVIDLSKKFNVPKTTKKVVKFPHWFHQTKNQCTECHLDANGGKLKNIKKGGEFNPGVVKGTGNKVHKEFCWPCHKAKKVPRGKSCNKCHK
ncbi:multiheme c-type cytochrome [Deferribacter desulfuricans SSM1]|uniref:Multiheme c-type cytochrome n=1 Tax=Deferribacter desulfuricans (strain DSM 14783 / JCM 11476 / NBRC 101012 / SSM1) TaxID=639282 RepID=D3PCH4_DEFDS|nr:cytochrome c3 family protein [Deferribacter desulfuricans]BAI80297.1 multiheme c-type cytochrome [Deferribacter desulfuricans SSM1]